MLKSGHIPYKLITFYRWWGGSFPPPAYIPVVVSDNTFTYVAGESPYG